jgi:hypothetical protein
MIPAGNEYDNPFTSTETSTDVPIQTGGINSTVMVLAEQVVVMAFPHH